jgi:hypothetical protein
MAAVVVALVVGLMFILLLGVGALLWLKWLRSPASMTPRSSQPLARVAYLGPLQAALQDADPESRERVGKALAKLKEKGK